MRASLILFGSTLLAQNALCANISAIFQDIKRQEEIVSQLATESQRLMKSSNEQASKETVNECIKALEAAKSIALETKKQTDYLVQNEINNVMSGTVDADGLCTVMINSVRRTIETAEALQKRNQDKKIEEEIKAVCSALDE